MYCTSTYSRTLRRFGVIRCYCGKEILYIVSECVCSLSHPEYSAHAPYYIVICDLSSSTTFFCIIS